MENIIKTFRVFENELKTKFKIKYTQIDKSTYATDTGALKFEIEINGIKGTGFWHKVRTGYYDVNEIEVNNKRIRIFDGGGTHKTYEISSSATKKENLPKNLRFTGEYYHVLNFKNDFCDKIKKAVSGEVDAKLTDDFIKAFNLQISENFVNEALKPEQKEAKAREIIATISHIPKCEYVKYKRYRINGTEIELSVDTAREARHPDEYGTRGRNAEREVAKWDDKFFKIVDKLQKLGFSVEVHNF